MTDHGSIFETLLRWKDAPMAIATVVSTWGSAPRPRGSHMLIHADERFEGSVSGGCVEGDVLATAEEVIRDRQPRLKHYSVASGDAWEVGLPCGGDIEILIQCVGDGGFPRNLAREILDAYRAGRTIEVATDLVSGLSRIGHGRSGITGAHPLFVNSYAPPWRLLIVGAVQIAQPLVQIAQTLGIVPTVIDPRARFLTPERFPGVFLDDRWPDDAIAAHLPDTHTAIVTLSHDIKLDDPALMAALATRAGYIAALGSTRSHKVRLGRLREAGLPEGQLDRIEGPAGIPIGALGPAEIALSIVSGIVRAFRAASPPSEDILWARESTRVEA